MRTDEQGVKWVNVTHETTGGTAEVPEAAFHEVYEGKGWTLAEGESDSRIFDTGIQTPPPAQPVVGVPAEPVVVQAPANDPAPKPGQNK